MPIGQQFVHTLTQIGSRKFMNREIRIHVGNGIRLAPLHIHPRRITHHEVETAVFEHVGEFELPVEETLLLGDFLHQSKPLSGFPVAFA